MIRYNQSQEFNFGLPKFTLLGFHPEVVHVYNLKFLRALLLVVYTLVCMHIDNVKIPIDFFPYPPEWD